MTQTTDIKSHALSTSVEETPSFILRDFRPGDIGYIVHRHGILYNQEYSWGPGLEAVVAQIVADFVDTYDPEKERCWIAESKDEGGFLGCVLLVKDLDSDEPLKNAKLRLLLVEPRSRGLGLGTSLIRQCTVFAREAGYSHIRLWTQSVLLSARRLYAKEGYRLVRSEDHASFGHELIGEYWELNL